MLGSFFLSFFKTENRNSSLDPSIITCHRVGTVKVWPELKPNSQNKYKQSNICHSCLITLLRESHYLEDHTTQRITLLRGSHYLEDHTTQRITLLRGSHDSEDHTTQRIPPQGCCSGGETDKTGALLQSLSVLGHIAHWPPPTSGKYRQTMQRQ